MVYQQFLSAYINLDCLFETNLDSLYNYSCFCNWLGERGGIMCGFIDKINRENQEKVEFRTYISFTKYK